MKDDLVAFVERSLAAGLVRDEIRALLEQAGWPADDVREALAHFADVDSPVPVPVPRPYVSARDAFVFLLLFLTLYTSSIAWGQLLFQFIHLLVPDPSDAAWFLARIGSQVRWATASLLVAVPIFLWLSIKTYRAARAHPEKRRSLVRKWLSYLTLFVAAGVLIGDLIALIYHLLDGELTARFLLKSLVVGGIAGSVFGYFFWLMRQDEIDPETLPPSSPRLRGFATAVTVLIGISIAAGLVVGGSPRDVRADRLDQLRVAHLESLRSSIQTFYERQQRLPESLDELSIEPGLASSPLVDPATETPFEYSVSGADTYELCAAFDTADEKGRSSLYHEDRFWAHEAARNCFRVVAHEDDE